MEHFGLFVANLVGVKGNWRLHSRHGQQLEKMIRHHIAESARSFVESTAMFDAHRFCRRDLHVVHVIAVPERLDDVVGKAENHDVLHRLFAKVMVDAINLLFREYLLQFLVELPGGDKVVAKRLLYDNACPPAVFLFRQATLAQHFDDRREETRSHRQVKKAVPHRVVLPVHLADLLFQTLVRFRVLKITFDVIDALAHPVQELRIDR